MKSLSMKCRLILILALACLITAIGITPESTRVTYLTDQNQQQTPAPPGHRSGAAASGSAASYQPVQNCSGGVSVNCHTTWNQAGL